MLRVLRLPAFSRKRRKLSSLLVLTTLGIMIAWRLFPPGTTTTTRPTRLPEASEIQELAKVFHRELQRLQNPPSCDGVHSVFGGTPYNGLASQVHIVVGCLIISNSLHMPCIQDPQEWPYSEPWNKYLKAIWSPCPLSQIETSKRVPCDIYTYKERFKDGLPIPTHLGKLINVTFQNEEAAVIWTLGQYAKFVFQLNGRAKTLITESHESLDVSFDPSKRSPLVGFQIRRTDKVKETSHFKSISDFLRELLKYETRLVRENVTFDHINVFLASDDHRILPKQKWYSLGSRPWKFVGFYSNRTYSNYKKRRTQLFPILRDIATLLECDYVFCTFSSNICRLLLELKMYTNSETAVTSVHSHTYPWLKSLDEIYFSDPLFKYMPLKFLYTPDYSRER